MRAVQVIDRPREAALLAAPVRQRILEALAEPGSASGVAKRLGLTRQVATYHFRQLEDAGFLTLVREEAKRGCTERFFQRSAEHFVVSNGVVGKSGLDARRLKDRFSSTYLAAMASQVADEVGRAQKDAGAAGRSLPTLAASVDIRFRSPADRAAFADELMGAIAALAAKYHDDAAPDGRTYRAVVGAYPAPSRRPPARAKETP